MTRVRQCSPDGRSPNAFDEISKRRCTMPPRTGTSTSCELLLEAGADVNANEEGTHRQHTSCDVADECSLAVATLLVDSGADSADSWLDAAHRPS